MTSGADQAVAARELELVTQASQGDGDAFTRFFDRHAAGVQLLVERLLGPGEAADEVVLEAFEKTVRRLPLLGARNSSPGLYVLATARNGAYAALGRQRPGSGDAAVAALLALPSRQRELLALREIGLDDAQCGEVAGIDPSDVGAQVARARLRLIDELEGETLSTVFVDGRAERLLGAEASRGDGSAASAQALTDEADARADEDPRFAAALSAVRSSSRSVGRLPAGSGTERFAAAARERVLAGATPARPGAPKPPAAPAGPVAGFGGAVPPQPAAAAPAPSTPDPYDDIVGDEEAWGIIDDDFPVGDVPTTTEDLNPPPGPEQPWEEPATQITPARTAPAAAEPAADAEDPWASALEWDDEDAWDAAGAPGAPGAPAAPAAESATTTTPGAATPEAAAAPPSDATVAFDAVAAGLVDPDPDAPGVPEAFDFGDAPADGEDQPKRGRWRWLLWVLATIILFAGAAYAAYTVVSSSGDSDRVPESSLNSVPAPTTAEDAGSGADAARERAASESRAAGKRSDAKAGEETTNASSGAATSSASSESAAASQRSTATTAPSGGSSSSSRSGGSSGAAPAPARSQSEAVVEGGETSSGGAVRGDAVATTP